MFEFPKALHFHGLCCNRLYRRKLGWLCFDNVWGTSSWVPYILNPASNKRKGDIRSPYVQCIRCCRLSAERSLLVDKIAVRIMLDDITSGIKPIKLLLITDIAIFEFVHLTSNQKFDFQGRVFQFPNSSSNRYSLNSHDLMFAYQSH